MAIGYELTTKFVKAHRTTSVTPSNGMRWLLKLMYEFWGFCVNGGNSLTVPGGIPASGTLMPPAFQSGSAVLLASGSDGVTLVGDYVFTAPSVNWTSGSLVGKHLVMWKSGSSSTDDSVYPILQVINSSSIVLDVLAGATPYTGTLHPAFTARTNINFRVVDFAGSTGISGFNANGDGLVLEFDGAPIVNSGQRTSQALFKLLTTGGTNPPSINIILSPSGSFSPTSSSTYFGDASTPIVSTNGSWAAGGATGVGTINLIGAQDFLIAHWGGTSWTGTNISSGFHVEIPQRLYAQQFDPNPIVALNRGSEGLKIDSSTKGYAGGWTMVHPYDGGSTASWRMLVRSLTGDYFNSVQYPSNTFSSITNGRFNEAVYNNYLNKFMLFDGVLNYPVLTRWASFRCRLRRVRFIPPILPNYQRLGNAGEWIHITNGVVLPWDNSILPYGFMLGGF